jgi:two-component system cell cycle response regulator
MKILVAQADPLARGMLESVLARWGYDVILAENGPQALARLKEQGGPNLAILERKLLGLGGLEICKEIRSKTDGPYIYLLLVMGKGQEQEVMEGLQAGADDCLSSPLSADELMIRLRIAKRILELQADLHRAQAAISYQTTHDPLTGLSNRAEVIATLRREMSRMQRQESQMGLILAAIDGLKSINDRHGHAAGDAVLRETARRIRSVVRPYDTVGRYTGEEFLVVVPGCESKTALTQADRLRATVAQGGMDLSEWGKFSSPQDGRLQVTLSLGVAAGRKVAEAEVFLRGAEAALRRAKQAGQNRVEAAREQDFR